jgi:hypothetical protein
MQARARLAVLIGLAGLGSGCMNDAYRRADGLTDSAGNAMASNTVMQMVDPWQDGVEDTRLLVPAARSATAGAADGAADAGASQPSTTGN